MRLIGRFLAGICAFLFVISGVTALIVFNIERKAFSPQTYKQAFEKQNLYARMPAILAVTIVTSPAGSGDAGRLLGILATEENFASLLPPQELKTVTDEVLDATFAYLNRETDSAVVSLSSLKRYLVSEGGVRTITQMLEGQPACTIEQVAQITFGLLSGGNLLLCNPPDEIMGLVIPLIQTQLQAVMGALPDQVTIISAEKSNTPDDPRTRLDRARAIMKLTVVLPLLLLPAMVIFAVRSLKDFLKWLGWPLLFTGGISLFIALIGSPVIEFVIGQGMQVQTSEFMPPVLLATMREAVGEITRQILSPVAIEGILLSAFGLGMVVAAAILTRLEKQTV